MNRIPGAGEVFPKVDRKGLADQAAADAVWAAAGALVERTNHFQAERDFEMVGGKRVPVVIRRQTDDATGEKYVTKVAGKKGFGGYKVAKNPDWMAVGVSDRDGNQEVVIIVESGGLARVTVYAEKYKEGLVGARSGEPLELPAQRIQDMRGPVLDMVGKVIRKAEFA